jgi:hypothetical protein
VTGPARRDHLRKKQKNPVPKAPFEPLSLAPGPPSLVPAKSGPGCFFSGRRTVLTVNPTLPRRPAPTRPFVAARRCRIYTEMEALSRENPPPPLQKRSPRCIYGQ